MRLSQETARGSASGQCRQHVRQRSPPFKALGACRSASPQKLGMVHARVALKQAPFPPLEDPVCLDAAHHQILNLNLKLELS